MRRGASSFGRIFPILAVLLVFSHLVRGGFSGLERLGWWEVAILGLLLLGICSSAVRYFRRTASGAPRHLRDDLEFGSSLIAAGYTVVSIGGPALFPLVFFLIAFVGKSPSPASQHGIDNGDTNRTQIPIILPAARPEK